MPFIYQAIVVICLVGQPCSSVKVDYAFLNLKSCMQYAVKLSDNMFMLTEDAELVVSKLTVSCVEIHKSEAL